MILRPRRLFSRALLAFASLVSGLVVAEIGLRLCAVGRPLPARPTYVDTHGAEITVTSHRQLYCRVNPIPYIDYELKPGARAFFKYDRSGPGPAYLDEHGRVPIHINAHGLRDREFPMTPAPGTHRILCLGDSFTFGFGVRLEDTYPKQLERLLHDRYPESRFEVINGGFASGNKIPNHVAYLLFKGHTFRPRTVILTICLNDIGDVPLTLLRWTRVSVPGSSRSRVLRLLSNVLTNHGARCLAADPDACFERACGAGVQDPDWRRGLEVAKAFCDASGFRLLVVIYPMMDHLDGSYPWTRIHEMVLDHCRHHAIEACDLLPAFRGRRDRDLWVHPADQHPSPAGHAIAARALATALNRRGWLP